MAKSTTERAANLLRAVAIRYARQKVDKVGQKGSLGPEGEKYRDRAIVGDLALRRCSSLTPAAAASQANPEKIPDEVWGEGEYDNYKRLLKKAEEAEEENENSDGSDGSDDEHGEDEESEEEEIGALPEVRPLKRKTTSSIPRAMSAKKQQHYGAGPSGSYNDMKEWAKLEVKMELKLEEMDNKLNTCFETYTTKFDQVFTNAQENINAHADMYKKAMEKTDIKVAAAEKAAEMAKQQVDDLKSTTTRIVTYTADDKYSMAELCKLLTANPELGKVMAAKMGIDLTLTENAAGPSAIKPRTRGGGVVDANGGENAPRGK